MKNTIIISSAILALSASLSTMAETAAHLDKRGDRIEERLSLIHI